MSSSRLDVIDALRGAAILLVIANHASLISGAQGVAAHLGAVGAYGVQLFFVVSAFTIFLTLDRARRNETHLLRNFFIRRLLRIAPLYWLAIAAYALLYGNESRGWLPGPQAWHYPLHLMLVNVLHPMAQSSVVPGGWSISVEVIFYLSVPVWFALVTSLRRACVFAAVSVLLGPLVVHTLAVAFEPAMAGLPEQAVSLHWYRHPLNQLGCFAFGIVLFFLHRDVRLDALRTPRHQAMLYLVAAMLALVGMKAPNTQHFMAASFLLVALALMAHPWTLIVNRAAVFMGRISYSAYVVHFLMLGVAAQWIGAEAGAWRFPCVALAATALTIPLASLCHHGIELPFIRLGRQLIAAPARPSIREISASPRQHRP
jgi:peptidoglycan/LPS O-acetylase OafA/YrhL